MQCCSGDYSEWERARQANLLSPLHSYSYSSSYSFGGDFEYEDEYEYEYEEGFADIACLGLYSIL